MANVTFASSPIATETNRIYASTASIARISSGQTKTLTITLITIGSIAIRIGLIMWIFRVAAARREDGARLRVGAFWMRPNIIAGLPILKRINNDLWSIILC